MMLSIAPAPAGKFALEADREAVELIAQALFKSSDARAQDLHFVIATGVGRWSPQREGDWDGVPADGP